MSQRQLFLVDQNRYLYQINALARLKRIYAPLDPIWVVHARKGGEPRELSKMQKLLHGVRAGD